MNSAEISILVKARDEASKVLDSVSKKAGALGGTLKTIGKTAALAFGGMAVAAGAFAVAGVGAASDLQESMSKVNVVFGKNSKEVQKWASTSAKAFGQSRQQALEAAGTFGNLFDAMGLTEDQTLSMSKSVVELASDFASFNNIEVSEAIEKLRAGLVGETEPMRALGVNINAAVVNAKALELGLGDVNGEVSEAAKVQARYALILEQSSNAQGDFARTSDGLANQQKILSAQWKDLKAQLGTAILPLFTLVTSALNEKVIPALESAVTAVANFVTVISSSLQGDIEAAAEAFNKLPPPLQTLALWLADNQPKIEDIAAAVRDLAQDALKGWQTILTALQPKLVEFGKWLGDHQPIAIALAIALAAVLTVMVGWPAVIVLITVAVGVLTTKVIEWRQENELLDGVLDGLTITLYRFADVLRFVTPYVEDLTVKLEANRLVLIALAIPLALLFLPLTATVAVFYAIGRAGDIASAAFDKLKNFAYFLKDALYSARDAAYAVRDAINSIPTPGDILPDLNPFDLVSTAGAAGRGTKKGNVDSGPTFGDIVPPGYRSPNVIDQRGAYTDAEKAWIDGVARSRGEASPFTNNLTLTVNVGGDATDRTVERIKNEVREEGNRLLRIAGLGGGFAYEGAFVNSGV